MPATSHLVSLDQDHPGFRDKNYRKQRDAIATNARVYWENREKGIPDEVPEIEYDPLQHKVWNTVYERVSNLLEEKVVSEVVEGFRSIDFPFNRIPGFSEVNQKLKNATGIQLVPVEGLVKPRNFFSSIAQGEFFCTQYIRHSSRPDFTPEPDICHDMFGHVPLLMSSKIAHAQVVMAKAAMVCDESELPLLEKIYWFTFEYGLCHENGKVKTYGAGNISSFADIQRCTDPKQIEHRHFNIHQVTETTYDPTVQQPILFVADSLDHALDEISGFLKMRFGV